ncbi:GHMP family kinase ATP-binding protein [Pelotomaculum terephthalicicum]|uniref:GHMP family kinase ATP-binding protein n=1 Tax=Pelotomaculum terephthalicicum TaxID=206393 RepID=UPI00289C687A|nr:GHMP kinase [Pelotomaculum terephthalicicum]
MAAYYERRKGAVLSTTIDKYVYVSVHPYFNRKKTVCKYSKTEIVDDIASIKHPVFRVVLEKLWPSGGIEVTSNADIPSGTGLGSSSSFTVALLNSIYSYRGTFTSKGRLAREACSIEIKELKEPIGKQDQYAAAYGGLNVIEFNPDGSVNVQPLMLSKEIVSRLQENLLMFYTYDQRDARSILAEQKEETRKEDKFKILSKMVDLVYEARDSLLMGDLNSFGLCLHKGWQYKCQLSDKISNPTIQKYYERALEYGAIGGKLLGAGGGGFLLFYCEKENQNNLRKALFDLPELPFRFDWQGAKIIYVGDKYVEEGFFEIS